MMDQTQTIFLQNSQNWETYDDCFEIILLTKRFPKVQNYGSDHHFHNFGNHICDHTN